MKDTYAKLSPKGLAIFILTFRFYKIAPSIIPFTLNLGLGRLWPSESMQELVAWLITHTMTD